MSETASVNKLSSISSASEKLGKLAASLWKILTFSLADKLLLPRRLLSVSIDKGMISVAYGRTFLSRITITGAKDFACEENRYPNPTELASAISSAIKEFGAGGTNIVLGIPKAWTIIKSAEFPATVKENIADVISYEIDRMTPFMPEEAVYDFTVISDTGERITLMVFVAKADAINSYREALRELGLDISGLSVATSQMAALCQYLNKKSSIIFVEVRSRGFESMLVTNGAVAHVVSDDLQQASGSTADTISSRIKDLADRARSMGFSSPQTVIQVKNGDSSLIEALKIKVPVSVFLRRDSDLGVRFASSSKDIPFAAVGGILESLWSKSSGLNLLSKGRRTPEKTPYVLTLMLLLAATSIWILYLMSPLKIEEKRLMEMNLQIEARKPEVRKVEDLKKEVEALRAEIGTIQNFRNEGRLSLAILRELTTILPHTAWLARARITDTEVEISGYAESATELLPKLEKSEYFRKVEFASPTIRDVRFSKDRFNIKMTTGEEKKSEQEEAPGAKK